MIRLLIYDIEDDRIRDKIAKECGNFGLERVQFSAFWGELTDNRCEELLLKCSDLLEDKPGRIHIFSLCKSCFARRMHYATEKYEHINEAPTDRTVNVWFLPDGPATEQAKWAVRDSGKVADTEQQGGHGTGEQGPCNPFADDDG